MTVKGVYLNRRPSRKDCIASWLVSTALAMDFSARSRVILHLSASKPFMPLQSAGPLWHMTDRERSKTSFAMTCESFLSSICRVNMRSTGLDKLT